MTIRIPSAAALEAAAAEAATEAKHDTLAAWLLANGFTVGGALEYGTWYSHERGSVAIDDGTVTVYVLDTKNLRARNVAWEARYSNAPLAVLIAAIRSALGITDPDHITVKIGPALCEHRSRGGSACLLDAGHTADADPDKRLHSDLCLLWNAKGTLCNLGDPL